MNTRLSIIKLFCPVLFGTVIGTSIANAQIVHAKVGELIQTINRVEVSFNDEEWQDASALIERNRNRRIEIHPDDRIRTRENSEAIFVDADGAIIQIPEMTTMRFGEPRKRHLLIEGMFYFFSRRPVSGKEFATDLATAAVKGTEFAMRRKESGEIAFYLVEGEVELKTDTSQKTLLSADSAVVSNNGSINPSSEIPIEAVSEWFAYYPTALILSDLNLAAPAGSPLQKSLSAYQSGDFAAAISLLQHSPTNIEGESLYRASLYLSLGQVEDATDLLDIEAGPYSSVVNGLRRLIAVISGKKEFEAAGTPTTSSEWIVQSYRSQFDGELTHALASVESASRLSALPDGIIHARKAELLFSLGRYDEAKEAAETALRISPQLVSAKSTLGFLNILFGNETSALALFSESIEQDPSYPESWLGRGLVHLRKGDIAIGTQYLETAAALSPNRPSYRTYLSRLFMARDQFDKANTEIELALTLDSADSNANLVSALINAANNCTAASISNLQKSLVSNDLRSIHRSTSILAEDEALRRTNLAQIYADSNLELFALREAAKAVNRDPGSFTAHKFLAQSYDSLRDPTTRTLRFQSPAQSERLNYNILSPARSGLLPLATTPNDYNNLLSLESDQLEGNVRGLFEGGFNTDLKWGKVTENKSYSLSGSWDYFNDFGGEWNFDQRTLEASFKADVSHRDTITTILTQTTRKSLDPVLSEGDDDSQEDIPSALIAWRRQWNPDSETIGYAQYISSDVDSRIQGAAVVASEDGSQVIDILQGDISSGISSHALQIELQHRQSWNSFQTITGLRAQNGDWQSEFELFNSPILLDLGQPTLETSTDFSFDRIEAYAYGYFNPTSEVTLIAGANATQFTYPINAFTLPPSSGESEKELLLPKIGLVWDISPELTLRLGYSESLGGLALEDGYRLEPTQIAGFLQGFRSLLAEALDGSHPAVEFAGTGIGITYTPESTSLFFDIEANARDSTSDRGIGIFSLPLPLSSSNWSSLTDFNEDSATLTASKIIGEATTFSLEQGYNQSKVHSTIPQIQTSVERQGDLSFTGIRALKRWSNGYFGKIEIRYYNQDLNETSLRNGAVVDEFAESNIESWQADLEIGWRPTNGSIQWSIGIKNLFDDRTEIDRLNWTPTLLPQRSLFVDLAW